MSSSARGVWCQSAGKENRRDGAGVNRARKSRRDVQICSEYQVRNGEHGAIKDLAAKHRLNPKTISRIVQKMDSASLRSSTDSQQAIDESGGSAAAERPPKSLSDAVDCFVGNADSVIHDMFCWAQMACVPGRGQPDLEEAIRRMKDFAAELEGLLGELEESLRPMDDPAE
jgi:hypothetical protein